MVWKIYALIYNLLVSVITQLKVVVKVQICMNG